MRIKRQINHGDIQNVSQSTFQRRINLVSTLVPDVEAALKHRYTTSK